MKVFIFSAFVVVSSLLSGLMISQGSVSALTQAECEDRGGSWNANARRADNCSLSISKYTPADQLRSYSYFNALSQCARDGLWLDEITSPGSPSDWMSKAGTFTMAVGYLVDGDDGDQRCEEIIKGAVNLWGYTSSLDYEDALKDFGYTFASKGCTVTGRGQTTDVDCYKKPGNLLDGFQAGVKNRLYGGATPSLEGDAGLLYLRAQFHIEEPAACNAQPYKKVSDLTKEEKDQYPTSAPNATGKGAAQNYTRDFLIVRIVDGTNWSGVDWVYKIPSENWKKEIRLNEKPSGGPVETTCYQLSLEMAGYADRIVKDAANIQANNTEPYFGDPSKKYGAVISTPGSADSKVAGIRSTAGDSTAGESTCGIEGLGWIVCPLLTFLGDIGDSSFDFLASNFLATDLSLIEDGGETQNAWGVIRNIANVAFVVAFLIIIFSQLTGAGVSNYGVKKLLPRIVISAILVNVSFFVCQIAVDLSNVLGYSLKTLFDSMGGLVQTTNSVGNSNDASGNGFGWAAIIITVTAAGVGLLLGVTAPVLLASVLALLLIALILFARKALIVLLIVIAPLAFVAYLLPNTEQWFKKWFKLFSSLLLLFPIISVVFGASSLAAKIIKGSSDDEMVQVIAIGVATVPLFLVPTLLKGSLDAAGMIGTKLSGLSTRANGQIGKKFKETSRLAAYNDSRKRNAQIKRAQITGGIYKGKNPFSRAASGLSGALNANRITGSTGNRVAQQAAQLANKLDVENTEASKAQITQANIDRQAIRTVANGGSSHGLNGKDPAMRAAALEHLVEIGDFTGFEAGWNGVVSGGHKETMRTVSQALARSSNKPAFMGASDLAEVALGNATRVDPTSGGVLGLTLHEVAERGTRAGGYSAAKLAAASNDELEYVLDGVFGGTAPPVLHDAATLALTTPEIDQHIAKNRGTISRM